MPATTHRFRGRAEKEELQALREVPVPWPDDLYVLVRNSAGSSECNPEPTAGFSPVYTNPSYTIHHIEAFSR